MESEVQLNEHNKEEYPPMHTAEHILNGTMVKLMGCKRSDRAHIERKKSKCDYALPEPLSQEMIDKIEQQVNEVIARNLPVTTEFAHKSELGDRFDLTRLPDDATELVRIVHVGDYDECLCVGKHVKNTSEIGYFRISSSRYADGFQRIVYRLDND